MTKPAMMISAFSITASGSVASIGARPCAKAGIGDLRDGSGIAGTLENAKAAFVKA
jgi:hypothetical protein